MNFSQNFSFLSRLSPFVRLWIGVLVLLFCFSVVNGIAWTLLTSLYGWDMDTFREVMTVEAGYVANRYYLLMAIAVSQAATWGLAGWLLMWLFAYPNRPLEGSQKLLLYLGILMMFAAIPVVQMLALDPKAIQFPSFLSGIETWMHEREQQSFALIKSFISTTQLSEFFLNIVVLAFVPAVCEELFFRGFLQKTLAELTSPLAAIFWGALLFSIFHFQFYGFFSRLLLGGILGYLYFLSKNVFPGILAHFCYNSLMVVVGYVYSLSGIEIPSPDKMEISPSLNLSLVSVVILGVLVHFSYKMIGEKAE